MAKCYYLFAKIIFLYSDESLPQNVRWCLLIFLREYMTLIENRNEFHDNKNRSVIHPSNTLSVTVELTV